MLSRIFTATEDDGKYVTIQEVCHCIICNGIQLYTHAGTGDAILSTANTTWIICMEYASGDDQYTVEPLVDTVGPWIFVHKIRRGFPLSEMNSVAIKPGLLGLMSIVFITDVFLVWNVL